MTDTVLVLGATGKTGHRLIPLLRAKGANVRAASRKPGEGKTLFDWARPETHGPALAGASAVYLVDPEMVEDPTPLTGPFLDQARKAGVRKLVLLSSLGITFPNEDGRSGRHRLERQVIESGLDWTILRPSGFNQNFSESFLLPGILHGNEVATATGDGAVGLVDAEDIAAVAAATLTEGGHSEAIYPLTGREALNFAEAATVISKAVGRTVTHRKISSDEFVVMLQGAGVPADYAGVLVRNQEAIRDGHGALVTDAVERVTGRAPIRFTDYAAGAAGAWVRL
jgi:uncharacterized protein YbjT (DUF2867 family)